VGDHDERGASEARGRWRSADAVSALASSYRANRELLEPLARLAVDVLAVVMLLRRNQRAPQPESDEPVRRS
jgi:hypothetical protein